MYYLFFYSCLLENWWKLSFLNNNVPFNIHIFCFIFNTLVKIMLQWILSQFLTNILQVQGKTSNFYDAWKWKYLIIQNIPKMSFEACSFAYRKVENKLIVFLLFFNQVIFPVSYVNILLLKENVLQCIFPVHFLQC